MTGDIRASRKLVASISARMRPLNVQGMRLVRLASIEGMRQPQSPLDLARVRGCRVQGGSIPIGERRMDQKSEESNEQDAGGVGVPWHALGSVVIGAVALATCWMPVVPVVLGACAAWLAWLSIDAEDARVWTLSGLTMGLLGMLLGALSTAAFVAALHALDWLFRWWNWRGI
jgi:hypothetical protein